MASDIRTHKKIKVSKKLPPEKEERYAVNILMRNCVRESLSLFPAGDPYENLNSNVRANADEAGKRAVAHVRSRACALERVRF